MRTFLLLLFAILLTTSATAKCPQKKKCCAKKTVKTDTIWMQYNETKCENPWQFSWFQAPTEVQIRNAVKSQLTDQAITILDIQSTYDKSMVSCEACHCPNGRQYYVRIPRSEAEQLKALKFFEIKTVPDLPVPDNTK